MNNLEHNDINSLLSSLDPEIKEFHDLIKSMSLINSPYKNEFNFMRVMVNKEKFGTFEGKIGLIIDELNQFGKILEKIVEDDNARTLYVESGLLEKCESLQIGILSKVF